MNICSLLPHFCQTLHCVMSHPIKKHLLLTFCTLTFFFFITLTVNTVLGYCLSTRSVQALDKYTDSIACECPWCAWSSAPHHEWKTFWHGGCPPGTWHTAADSTCCSRTCLPCCPEKSLCGIQKDSHHHCCPERVHVQVTGIAVTLVILKQPV